MFSERALLYKNTVCGVCTVCLESGQDDKHHQAASNNILGLKNTENIGSVVKDTLE